MEFATGSVSDITFLNDWVTVATCLVFAIRMWRTSGGHRVQPVFDSDLLTVLEVRERPQPWAVQLVVLPIQTRVLNLPTLSSQS